MIYCLEITPLIRYSPGVQLVRRLNCTLKLGRLLNPDSSAISEIGRWVEINCWRA